MIGTYECIIDDELFTIHAVAGHSQAGIHNIIVLIRGTGKANKG